MAKRYYNVFIRPAGVPYTNMEIPSLTNILSGWDRIELLTEKPKLSVEGEFVGLADGTQHCESETVAAELGTLRVDAAQYAFLRSTYANKLCDLIFMAEHASGTGALPFGAFGLRIVLGLPVESGSSIICSLSGKKSYGLNATKFIIGDTCADICLFTGKVYAEDGVTPVAAAMVTATIIGSPYADVTDADGEYLLIVPEAGTYAVTIAKTGGWEWDGADVAVVNGVETIKNWTAKTNGS